MSADVVAQIRELAGEQPPEQNSLGPIKFEKALIKKYLSRSPSRFASYLAITRALADVHNVPSDKSTVTVLRFPQEWPPSDFSPVVLDVLHQSPNRFDDDDTEFHSLSVLGKKHRLALDHGVALTKQYVTVLTNVGIELPDEVKIAVTNDVELDLCVDWILRSMARHYQTGSLSRESVDHLRLQPTRIIDAVFRPGHSAEDAVRRHIELAKSTARTRRSSNDIGLLTFDDVVGFGAARSWGLSFLQDVDRWREGTIHWRELDSGVLLVGPPGSGKTRFAHVLANSSGMNFIPTSLGIWQANGALDDLLAAMHKDFKAARDHAPSILFIDELDSFGDRVRFRHSFAHYSVQVMNAFLAAVDGSVDREGVFVIGATNYPEYLDIALLRSGRFEKRIELGYPDADERLALLCSMSPQLAGETRLVGLARRLEQWSRSDLDQLVREARKKARNDGRGRESIEDLEAPLPKVEKLSKENLEQIAVHEAGHAICAIALGRTVKRVFIRKVFDPADRSRSWGRTEMELSRQSLRADEDMLADITIFLAGMAAEEVVLARRSNAAGGADGSDLNVTTNLAFQYLGRFGLGGSLVQVDGITAAELHLHPLLQSQVNSLLNDRYAEAKRLVDLYRDGVRHLANELARVGELDAWRTMVMFRRSRAYKSGLEGSP